MGVGCAEHRWPGLFARFAQAEGFGLRWSGDIDIDTDRGKLGYPLSQAMMEKKRLTRVANECEDMTYFVQETKGGACWR